jgi:putative membrane protein
VYGKTLSDLIGETLEKPSAEPLGPSVELGYFRTLVRELQRADRAYGKRTLRTQRRTLERLDDRISRGAADEKVGEAFVVCASGNLAHVYLTHARERLTTERLVDEHPGLVETLIAHPGIGFVATVRENGEVLVMGKNGARRLPSGEIDGEDPLVPFLGAGGGEHALAALSALAAFPRSGDFIVNGAMLEKNAVVTFEEQAGTHGGLGGSQTEPFIIYPRRLKASRENLRNPAEIHAFLKTILS